MSITVDTILSILNKTIDILLVWLMFYYILKNMKNNVKLTLIFKGVLIVAFLKIISDFFKFVTIGLLLEYVIMWGPLALIIIFQPEIRTILEQLGRTQLLGRHKTLTVDEREKLVYQIIQAVDYLRKAKIGGLIVLERDVSLQDYINKSINLYADVTPELLIESGLIKKELDGIKILGNGELTKKLTVKANKFSSTAKTKIENVGGTIEVI